MLAMMLPLIMFYIMQHIFYFLISNFPAMYVKLTIPRIVAWNDFLVKQCIKLELEMLGGFSKVELVSTSAEQDETEKNKVPTIHPDENEDFDVICARMEATQRQITDAQRHLNSLIASYNRDMKVLRTRVSERPNVEKGVFFANEDPFTQATQYVGVSAIVHNKMKSHRHRQRVTACKSHFVQLCVSKYKRLIEEETHVTDYVFDECHTGMYVILYMQHWDGSGLNRTINSEHMSLERLKFATHMVLDSENEIGEMVTTNIWSTNDA
ncbi:hypothetical protein AAG906_015903 [Vitis piasezkii]